MGEVVANAERLASRSAPVGAGSQHPDRERQRPPPCSSTRPAHRGGAGRRGCADMKNTAAAAACGTRPSNRQYAAITHNNSAGPPGSVRNQKRATMTENLATIGETPARTLQHRTNVHRRRMGRRGVRARPSKLSTPTPAKPGPPRRWPVAPDVRKAVDAARRALSGPWGSMSAAQRGVLIRRLAALIAPHADELARIETTDNGKVIRETRAQMAGLPATYEFFAGAADKIFGATISAPQTELLHLHPPRAHRRRRRHPALEQSAVSAGEQARARPGRRMHRRRQTRRADTVVDAGVRQAR